MQLTTNAGSREFFFYTLYKDVRHATIYVCKFLFYPLCFVFYVFYIIFALQLNKNSDRHCRNKKPNMNNRPFTALCDEIFERAIADYHVSDDVDTPIRNPYAERSIKYYLYLKCWIDTVQWHLEDIIRDPDIDPVAALAIKRRIDRSNQERTDLVEMIDSYFLDTYSDVAPQADATINTESPAWAVDRLSILYLKIYHMRIEAGRADADEAHRAACQKKLDVLLVQRTDLASAIDQLLADIAAGRKYMKVYRQMKMYNDPSLNPVLYK